MQVWFLWLILLRSLARADFGVISDVSDETFEFLINGGYKPTNNRWSRHVVSIRTLNYMQNPGGNHFCAGILISSRAVLTAAHCLTDRYKATLKPQGIQVVFGHPKRLSLYEAEHNSRIADRLMVHPDYERFSKNDLAVIRLGERIPSYVRDVQPVLLRRKANLTINASCVTMGWGQLYEHGPYSNEILYLDVLIRPASLCEREFESYSAQENICVEPDGGAQHCAGDMGGPLICEGALAGIIAGTLGCEGGKAMKFASFPFYKDWIESILYSFQDGGVMLSIDILLLWSLLGAQLCLLVAW